ncbi:MAG: hypothetical protein DHS20C14_07150 [Phycisphaeraceae bacterium]|nr:MAG: hypothetical protein DHS20C14_07150 [Phycisphaeraceae bacterium]
MGLREAINERPWIGWAVAGVALAVAGFLLFTRMYGSGPADSAQRRAQTVTIQCTETGEEWEMNRGEFERLLMTMPGQVDPTKGIPSPHADGRLTGVLVDKSDWESTVDRINLAKEVYGGKRRGSGG